MNSPVYDRRANRCPLAWPTKDPRERAEWDFRARWKGYDEKSHGHFEFLPPEEVWFCHWHEFDRTLPCEVEGVLKERKHLSTLTFDALLDHHWRTDGNGKCGVVLGEWAYALWPEWPDRPYMSVDWVERKRRRDACWPKEKRRPQTLRLLPLDEIYKVLHADVSACSEFVRASFRCRPGDDAVYDHKVVTIRRKDRDDGREYTNIIAAFDIDFSLSDTQLAKLFQNWCREQQREKGLKQKENRGQCSDTKRLRNELQSLGAWRLIQSGLTYKQAAKYTEEISGKPLYAHPGEWSNAVNAAKELRYRYS